jgi:MFS family permease
MQLGTYREVLGIRDVRRVLLLGLALRVPQFAAGIAVTLHVVSTLGRSYGEAGLVAAAYTLAMALSAPWRGRLLDRYGLRRTLWPSVVAQVLVWSVAPFLPYAALLPAAVVAGAFQVPTFSILRQAVILAVSADQRRTTLSLDSVTTELSFMAGPAVGVYAATTWDTRWVLVALQGAALLACLALMVVNPPLRSQDKPQVPARPSAPAAGDHGSAAGVRAWLSPGVVAVLGAAVASTVVLAGTDVAIIAALRSLGHAATIGAMMALWAAGSLVGGLLYGAWHRSLDVFGLLAALAVTAAPIAFTTSLPWFAGFVFVSGIPCAPLITAMVDRLSRLVHERSRGEVMGWHGSAMTVGNALGAPLAGYAIDRAGWQWGFLCVAVLGVLAAVLGAAASGLHRAGRRRSSPAGGVAGGPGDSHDAAETVGVARP